MKHKFREQCAWCHKWTNDYDTSIGDIVCKECMSKNSSKKDETINSVELCEKYHSGNDKAPQQLDMEYFLSGR
ncbi:hypothetical protein MKC90_02485 [[Clostridium] innocuum]|nr:hypothetical protein [[Clostridium] innocuum]